MAVFENMPFVTLDMIPNEIRATVPITLRSDDFKTRLKTGGTLTLRECGDDFFALLLLYFGVVA